MGALLGRRGGSFPWIVIAMLAVGVGASTAIFSVANGVLLRPLPFPHPGRLVLVGETSPQVPNAARFAYFDTPSAFLAWRREASDFSGLAAIQSSSFTLTGAGRPRALRGAEVSTNFFDLLEVRPRLGRLFASADATDATLPMVITDRLWRSAFAADPAVIGRIVGPPQRPARIVGVLAPQFRLAGAELGPMVAGEPVAYFVPLDLGPHHGGDLRAVWSNFNYTVIGRLRPGVSIPQALAQLDVVQANLARSAPDRDPQLTLLGLIAPVRDYAVAAARRQLWLLLAAVAAVLLIICVNLGGLWTSRIAARRRDWAIRAALGAAPGRLARQLLREAVALAVLGGIVGVGCAAIFLRGLLAAAPAGIPRLDEVHVDWRVLLFGALLAVLAGLITGLVPALRLGRADPQVFLRASGSATTPDRASARSRQWLIATQAALATLLLIVAGLLALSFHRLLTRPTGFTPSQALAADVVLNAYSDAQRDRIVRQLPAAVAAIPGIAAVGITSHLPLAGETWIDGAGVPGRAYPPGQAPSVNVRFISPGYFSAIGIPLLAGRPLRESDRPAGWPPPSAAAQAAMRRVVVISGTTARLLFPGVAPRALVGRKMLLNDQPVVIAGVAADALDGTLTTAPPSVLYQPYWEYPPYALSLVVRSPLPPTALAAALRAAVWKLAPEAPIPALRPLSGLRQAAVAPRRFQLTLLLLFAAVALWLAALGVYALAAQSVAARAKEFAIRRSLGARAGELLRLIAAQSLAPVALGGAAGLLAALALGGLVRSLLFAVSPTAPSVLLPALLVVFAAAAAGCVLPALRALRADPWPRLRAE